MKKRSTSTKSTSISSKKADILSQPIPHHTVQLTLDNKILQTSSKTDKVAVHDQKIQADKGKTNPKKRSLKDVEKQDEEEKKSSINDNNEEIKSSAQDDLQNGDSGKKRPLNNEIAEQLDRLFKYYQTLKDKGRMWGYKRAVTQVRSIKEPIYSLDQLKDVPNIGEGILKKLREYVAEGSIKRFEFIDTDEKIKTLQLFEQVWGIGPSKAQELWDKKMRSIEDLRNHQSLLTSMQKIGLKYFEDFNEKIPREEVTKLLEKVREISYKVIPMGEKILKIEACGSYRRGRQLCGDIDVLVTRTDGEPIHGLNEKIVVSLEKEGFLKERLGDLRKGATGHEGYQGICQLSPKHKIRRIDLKVYPSDQYGYALLYFTGSGNFNVDMRTQALKQGYTLSDHGMHKIGQKNGKSIPALTEEEVFKALGLEYKAPNERDI
eukprot:403339784